MMMVNKPIRVADPGSVLKNLGGTGTVKSGEIFDCLTFEIMISED
jgi:hypothetical protein